MESEKRTGIKLDGCATWKGRESGMLKKILEKKKLWLSLALAVSLMSFLLTALDVIFTLQQTGNTEVVRPLAVVAAISLLVESVIVCLYYIYRLFYLYKGTEKRVLWTALTIAGVVMLEVDTIPTIGAVISVLGVLILLACWGHDIMLVFSE